MMKKRITFMLAALLFCLTAARSSGLQEGELSSASGPDLCRLYGAVFIEEVETFGDYKVFREDVESFADLVVFREQARSFADRPGLWYITDVRAQADFTISFTNMKGFADFSVFFTEFKSVAGCGN